MLVLDPLGAIVKFIEVWRRGGEEKKWAELYFSLWFAAIVAFLSTTGGWLSAGSAWSVSIGYGMIAAATSLTAIWLASPLTRGMTASIPKKVIEEVQKLDDVRIEHK